MNEERDLQSILDEVISASKDPEGKFYGTGLWKKCHMLANSHYLPAKNFFLQELEDSRWMWRRESVRLLGFHYELGVHDVVKVKKMLLNDPDSDVRIACASFLGKQSEYPDIALFTALQEDPNPLVKETAFDALLSLAGISYKRRKQEVKNVHSGKLQPSPLEVKRVLIEEGKPFVYDNS